MVIELPLPENDFSFVFGSESIYLCILFVILQKAYKLNAFYTFYNSFNREPMFSHDAHLFVLQWILSIYLFSVHFLILF